MNVALYGRYSSDKQDKTSIEQQFNVCYEYCRRNNLSVVAEYRDEAISGRTDRRPQFQKMIVDSKNGLFQAVVVYGVDRFSRVASHAFSYVLELENNGVDLLSATEHFGNTSSGKLSRNIKLVLAQFHTDNMAEGISRGLDYNAEHGFVTGGSTPFGYKREGIEGSNKKRYVVDEEIAPLVKRIFEMFADGEMQADIITWLNNHNIKTIKGNAFSKNNIKRIVENKRYVGIYTYGDKEFPGLFPRIIDDELFERAQQVLKANKIAPARKRARGKDEYILTLKLFCGHCKEPMSGYSGRGKGEKYKYYMCNGRKKGACKKQNIRKEYLEDTVIAQCRSLLTDENIQRIASAIVAYNEDEQRNNEYLKGLHKAIAKNKKDQDSLMRALKSSRNDKARSMVMDELGRLGEEETALQIDLTREEGRKITIYHKEITFFLTDLRNGDANDIKYKKMLINVLVDKIYLYDDGKLTIVCYNGDTTVEIETNVIDKIEKDCYINNTSPPPAPAVRLRRFAVPYATLCIGRIFYPIHILRLARTLPSSPRI